MLPPRAAAILLALGAATAHAEAAFQVLRHDEDGRPPKGATLLADPLDALKYLRMPGRPDDWYLSIGGEIRERYELFQNDGFDASKGNNGFLLQRYLLFAGLRLGSQVRLFASLQSSLENGRAGGPRPPDRDDLDLHEAFVDANFDASRTVTLRLGRRELAFGSQRLVSIRAGPNVRQAFDGASLLVRPGGWSLELFAVQPAQTTPGIFDDASNNSQKFWGAYSTLPLPSIEHMAIDLYYLGLDRDRHKYDQGSATELRDSIGTRIWGDPGRWGFNFEFVYQWGRFGTAPIRAWTAASDTTLALNNWPASPRIGLKADVTSGDKNPNDLGLQTFNPLFPKGAYFGESQLLAPLNHIDLHPYIDLRPLQFLTVTPSCDFFWRTSLEDGLYNIPGNLVRSGKGKSGRYVATELAIAITANLSRHITVLTDFEYYLPGAFLRESGPADNLSFFATWVTFQF